MATMTPSLEAAIEAGHINHIAQVIEDYLVEDVPEARAVMFNQDIEEIAMRVWLAAEGWSFITIRRQP